MIAIDTNLLVYAHRREVGHHETTRALLAELAEGDATWAIPWPCVYEFWSVVTNPRIWATRATPPEHAWLQIQAWSGSPSLRLIGETDGFLTTFAELARAPRVRGPVVHDARVAAVCLANGVDELWTADRDFALFPQLRTRNPLRSPPGR